MRAKRTHPQRGAGLACARLIAILSLGLVAQAVQGAPAASAAAPAVATTGATSGAAVESAGAAANAAAASATAAGNANATATATAIVNATDTQALILRGKYLAVASDCIACHDGGKNGAFAGGKSLATPLGAVYATNITPSKTHGIGNYTEAQFARALREGVRADGAHLYPAMPYTAYAKITDDDVKALYTYFMHDVAPVDAPTPAQTALPFPFGIRATMGVWNALFLDDKPFVVDPKEDAVIERGRYLGQALAHCATCHTPRNALMAEDDSRGLSGSSMGTWFAPNITPDRESGIGDWSTQDIASYLRTGRVEGRAQAAGPMAEAIDHSLAHLSDADIHALALWLKSVPAVASPGSAVVGASGNASGNVAAGAPASVSPAAAKTPSQWGSPSHYSDTVRAVPVPGDRKLWSGAQLYDAYCASCHQAQGDGANGLPSLIHNTAIGRANADNLVMVMLEGIQRLPDTNGVAMPAFHHLLSDDDLAKLGTYVMQQYGNPAGIVTAQRVAELRQGGAPSPLVPLARWGMAAGAAIVLVLLAWWLRRRQRRRGAP